MRAWDRIGECKNPDERKGKGKQTQSRTKFLPSGDGKREGAAGNCFGLPEGERMRKKKLKTKEEKKRKGELGLDKGLPYYDEGGKKKRVAEEKLRAGFGGRGRETIDHTKLPTWRERGKKKEG